jgi:drug/metabolite transporter (DMT)-like permease
MIQEALIVLFLFAINPIINKFILRFISVKSLILFTGFAYFVVAGLCLFFLNDKTIQNDLQTLNKPANRYLWAFIIGFPIVHLITHYFYFSLIRDNKTYLATAIVACYPLLIAVFGYFILGEQVVAMDLLGILFIVIGLSIIQPLKD